MKYFLRFEPRVISGCLENSCGKIQYKNLEIMGGYRGSRGEIEATPGNRPGTEGRGWPRGTCSAKSAGGWVPVAGFADEGPEVLEIVGDAHNATEGEATFS